MSKVLSVRLKDGQFERLSMVAGRLGRTCSGAAVMLLEEALRREEFVFIDFRNTLGGREAFLQGTRIPVWQVAWLARYFDGAPDRLAGHLELPLAQVKAALAYADAYPNEMETALAAQARSPEELARMIPNLRVHVIDAPSA